MEILPAPIRRPVVGLGLPGQVTVELDLGIIAVAQTGDALCRPDIGTHGHSHPEDVRPAGDHPLQLSLNQAADHSPVEV